MGQALVGLVVAMGIAAFAYGKNRAVRAKLRGRPRAEGEVVGHRKNHRGSGPGSPTSYAPVVEFADVDGRRVRGESGSFTKSVRPEVGAEVTVLYDPADPSRINVAGRDTGEAERFFFGASLVLVGIAVAGLAGTLLKG